MVSLIYNPPVSFIGTIPGGFLPGCFIRVQGQPNTAGRFSVNIRSGSGPSDNTALHVNPRIGEGCVVRSSFLNGAWGISETEGPPLKVQSGKPFEILLRCEYAYTRIAVNGEEYPSYNHRFNELEQLTTLKFAGEITLSLVQIVVDPHSRPDGLAFPYPAWAYQLPFVLTHPQRLQSLAVTAQPSEHPSEPPPSYEAISSGSHSNNKLENVWGLAWK